jgi:SAM-dependent methyltransferase
LQDRKNLLSITKWYNSIFLYNPNSTYYFRILQIKLIKNGELKDEIKRINWFHKINLGNGIITPGIDYSPTKLKGKIDSIIRHPSIIKDIVKGKEIEDIRDKVRRLDDIYYERQGKNEILQFISYLKKTSHYNINLDDKTNLNRLCYVEDWQNAEFRETLMELQKLNPQGLIHRKDWEWAIGIMAMKRFDKLNKSSTAIGVGSGTEPIPFYLANKISHVYATDLYEESRWKEDISLDFPEDPQKYSPFPYREDALTVMRMDGSKLDFPDETFDIAFSFSSIEHFGGKNHSGALKAMREIERVLKPGGIAVIATEYILNGKKHPEFFNKKTIHSDLIDKINKLKPVEPLDLRMTASTLDTIIDHFTIDANWDNVDEEYKKSHPLVLLKIRNILFTSIMIVFQKQA